jgi:site-specific recombinase XerD
LEDVKICYLRRTFATKLLASGVDLRTVMGVTGHARAQTLVKHYAQAVPGKHREALKGLFHTGT